MKHWSRSLLTIVAVVVVGLPAAPAAAESSSSCSQAVGSVYLRGFPPEMSFQPPNFYYTSEGQDKSFQVEGSIDCAPGESTATGYDTPPGATDPATDGADYTRKSGVLNFGPSTSEHYFETKTVAMDFHQDSAVEALAEEVNVKLQNPINANLGTPSQAPFYIVDDDGSSRLRLVATARTVLESPSTLKIPVLLAGTSPTVPVSFSVSPSSASDLEPASGSVTWATGGRLGIVNLQMKNDTVCETAETYTISLSSGSAQIEGDSTFSLTINDNDNCGTTHTLSVSKSGTGLGTVTSNPAGINCGSDCAEAYVQGTNVTLTASPAAGSTFGGWSGGGCSGTGTCVVSMTQARSVTATFNQTTTARHTLTVAKSGTGSGTVTSTPAGISCGSDCTQDYDDGTSVTLTANPAAGSTFAGWSGACTGTGTCTVSMTQDRNVTATFNQSSFTLTVSKSGTGAGTVTSSPAGISCGSDCTQDYASGTSVTLTATPASGSTFGGWGGDCAAAGTNTQCMLTMNGDRNVSATFNTQQAGSHTLTVSKAGNGAGSVGSSPAGIACGSDCTETYDSGTTVTLTANAGPNSVFTGWSGGGCSGTSPTCTVTMNQDRAVTATFELVTRTLSVTRNGTGTGTVTSSPAGISCGADCSEAYDHGTSVTLTASPAAGSTFAGWSGGGCSGTGSCVVTMDATKTVTATFNLNPVGSHTLTVARDGNAAHLGTVTSSPAGIDCGSDCSHTYNDGTPVTLTASPARLFVSWAGDAPGCTTNTCPVEMSQHRNVTAIFQDNVDPRAWFHHPKHRARYERTSPLADTIHLFADDDVGHRNIAAAHVALRRKMRNGSCQFWSAGAWRATACNSPRWIEVTNPLDWGGKWLYIYEAYPSLAPSVGTRIASYTVFGRTTDSSGNASPIVTGDSRNTFEVTRN